MNQLSDSLNIPPLCLGISENSSASLRNSLEKVPFEVLHIILSYDGSIKYRNGKWMNQLSNKDGRYDLLRSIPRPMPSINNDLYFCFILYFTNKKYKLSITNFNNHYHFDNKINYNFWSTNSHNIRSSQCYKRY
jgi:hypothetical protein